MDVLETLRARAARRARLRALAAAPMASVRPPPAPEREMTARERGVFNMLQTRGFASVDGGPSARIVPHPSVAGRAMNDQSHLTVEVTWQGKRSWPFATEPPMTIADAQLAAAGLLLDPARWPGKRAKKINHLQAADVIEKALKKAGYTEIRRTFDPHAPECVFRRHPVIDSERRRPVSLLAAPLASSRLSCPSPKTHSA